MAGLDARLYTPADRPYTPDTRYCAVLAVQTHSAVRDARAYTPDDRVRAVLAVHTHSVVPDASPYTPYTPARTSFPPLSLCLMA